MDSYASGHQSCEQDFLIPLQSGLQEFLIKHKDHMTIESWNELAELLSESDFEKQWSVE